MLGLPAGDGRRQFRIKNAKYLVDTLDIWYFRICRFVDNYRLFPPHDWWLGVPKPRLGHPKPRPGVAKPGLVDLKPRLGHPKPRVGGPKPRLGVPKPRLEAWERQAEAWRAQPRLMDPKPWGPEA